MSSSESKGSIDAPRTAGQAKVKICFVSLACRGGSRATQDTNLPAACLSRMQDDRNTISQIRLHTNFAAPLGHLLLGGRQAAAQRRAVRKGGVVQGAPRLEAAGT